MRALGVVGVIQVRWVHSFAPSRFHSGLLGSLGALPGCGQIHSGSFDSFGRALGVVAFILWRPGGHRVHSGSLGSFWRVLGIVGFFQVRWVHSAAPWVSSGLFVLIRECPSYCRVD